MTISISTLTGRVSHLISLGLTALKDPGSDPRAALITIGFLAAALLVVALVVVLVVVLVRDAMSEDDEEEPEDEGPGATVDVEEPVRRRRPGLAVLGWAFVLLLACAGIAAGFDYGTSDAACARCHFPQAAIRSHASEPSHAKVACRSCHVPPTPGGALSVALGAVGNIRTELSGDATAGVVPASVSNSACLSCHEDVLSSVGTALNIRMRHSDVLAVGYACTDCHATVGHGERVARVRYPTMAQCITCHDGARAKSACATCHTSDVGLASRVPAQDSLKVHIVVKDCRGCHSVQKCIDCHGIELPHSPDFIAGYHARQALKEPRVCLKCHTVQTTCNNCHRFAATASGLPQAPHDMPGGFVAWHKQTSGSGMGSCSCHGQDPKQFCGYCHGKTVDH